MSDVETRLLAFVADYKSIMAHPYRWTYLGTPLVVPGVRKTAQERQGTSWSVLGRNGLSASFIRQGAVTKRQAQKTG